MDSSKLFPMIGIIIWSAVALTAAPRALSHRHPAELSVKGDDPIRTCSDLNVSFENRRAIVESEERTVTKAEASTLRIRAESNGGLQVEGWDQDNVRPDRSTSLHRERTGFRPLNGKLGSPRCEKQNSKCETRWMLPKSENLPGVLSATSGGYNSFGSGESQPTSNAGFASAKVARPLSPTRLQKRYAASGPFSSFVA